jgi:hypothetical protein
MKRDKYCGAGKAKKFGMKRRKLQANDQRETRVGYAVQGSERAIEQAGGR